MKEQIYDKYDCISLINKSKDELFDTNKNLGCNSKIYEEYKNSTLK